MRVQANRSTPRWARYAGLLTCAVLVLACKKTRQPGGGTDTTQSGGQVVPQSPSGYPIAPQDTAPPPFSGPIERISTDSILAYARSLRYDEIGKDSQRLVIGTRCPENCRFGPLASVFPQAGTHALTRAQQLERGRIIARLINHDNSDYPKLNLAPRDTAYLWFYRSGGSWWGIYISRRGIGKPHRGQLEPHKEIRPYHPMARWLWSDRDDGNWVGCGLAGCCRVDALEGT